MGPKKQKASNAEKAAIALGKQQVDTGSQLKQRFSGAVNALARQDDANILRAKTNAGVNGEIIKQLGNTSAAGRALAISTGNNAGAMVQTGAADTNARTRLSKLKTTADLVMGSTGAANNSIVSTAAAQNNAAATLTRASMEKQQRVINNLASIPGAYTDQKQAMTAFNNDALRTQSITGAPTYQQMNMWGRIKDVKVNTGG